jgi:FtsH-binding integral membrane protein
MLRFLLVGVTGWIAVLAFGVEVALPYLLREGVRKQSATVSSSARLGRVVRLREKMWPHYWLGYGLAALVVVHSSFVMGPVMGRADAVGIWAATLGLCAIFLQIGLGLLLKTGSDNQRQIRRWHFWSMLGLVGMVMMHLARNSY